MTPLFIALRKLLAPEELDQQGTSKVLIWANQLVNEKSDSLSRAIKRIITMAQHSPLTVSGPVKNPTMQRSVLWTLAGLSVDHRKAEVFSKLACEMLFQVGKCAQYWGGRGVEQDPRYSSAVRNAGRALARLMNLSVLQLKELFGLFSSTENDALDALIYSQRFSKKEVADLRFLRSLQNLAYGHRVLRGDAGNKYSSKRRVVNYRSIPITDEEYAEGVVAFTIPYVDQNDEDLGEVPHDCDTVCFVKISLEKVKRQLPDKTLTAAQLFARASQLAKQRARSNNFSKLDMRWMEPGVLQKVDRYICSNRPVIEKAFVLLPLLTGRSLSSLSRSIFDANEPGVIRLQVNSPDAKATPFSMPVSDHVDVPIPVRWLSYFEGIKRLPSSQLSFRRNYSRAQKNVLKRIDFELRETQLRHLLPLTLKLLPQHDAFSSLLFDSISATDITRQHYFCLPAVEAQAAIAEAWSVVENDLDNPMGPTLCTPQSGHIGSRNNPDPAKVADWCRSLPLDDFHGLRQRLVEEGQILAHRGVIDPKPEFVVGKVGFRGALMNDKDRGGRKQMARLALLSAEQNQALLINDRQFSTFRNSGQNVCVDIEARCWDREKSRALQPSRLCEAVPILPGPANAGRKIFASYSQGISGEYLAAHMGWLTHGMVPFSYYSTLSPLQLAWARELAK